MWKLLGLMVILSVFGCTVNINTTTTLTIQNNTSRDIDYVQWYDYNENMTRFGSDNVQDTTAGYVTGLFSGHSDKKTVKSGSSPVYFYYYNDTNRYATVSYVEVATGDDKVFSLMDTTVNYASYQIAPSTEAVPEYAVPKR